MIKYEILPYPIQETSQAGTACKEATLSTGKETLCKCYDDKKKPRNRKGLSETKLHFCCVCCFFVFDRIRIDLINVI